ncbi:nuclear transport factor 2 family protein, partial [Tritonibacter sp. SIMBA_163]
MGALQDADGLLQALSAGERAVRGALVPGDADADAALLCERFLGVYSSGFADRADHRAQLHHGPTVEADDLTELQARALG